MQNNSIPNHILPYSILGNRTEYVLNMSPMEKSHMISRSEPDMLKVSKNRDTVSYRKIGHCLDCGHTWTPRTAKGEKPSRCSKCGSYNCAWDDELTESIHGHNTQMVKKPDKKPAIKHISQPQERTLEPPLIPAVATPQEKADENPEPDYRVWKDKNGNDESDVLMHPVEMKNTEIAAGSIHIETEPEDTFKEIGIPNAPGLPSADETQEKEGEENLEAWPTTYDDDDEIKARAEAILTRNEGPNDWIQDERLLSRQMGISVDELESALSGSPNFEVISQGGVYRVAYYSDEELTESKTECKTNDEDKKKTKDKKQVKGGVPILIVVGLVLGFGGLFYIWSLPKAKKTKKSEELSPAEKMMMFRLSEEGRNQEITNRIRAVNGNLRNPVLSPNIRSFPSIM